MNDIFALWTPISIALAAMSGIALAVVVDHLTSNVRPALTTLLVVTLGCLWYIPQDIGRFIDPEAFSGSGQRTVGTFALFLFGFMLPMSIVLHLLHRRDRG